MKFVLPLLVLAIALLLAATALPDQSNGSVINFIDVSPQSGLNFTLNNSPTAAKYMIETMAGGLAVFDFDGDGKPDIFFTNGSTVPGLVKTGPNFSNRLYRNLGGLHFADVTPPAGLAGEGYAMAAAAADFDNDGHPDLSSAGSIAPPSTEIAAMAPLKTSPASPGSPAQPG